MTKVIRDGKVAVLYSPGYGAGWYTWESDVDPFDSEMVEAIEDKELLKEIAERKYPDTYKGGLRDLEVTWLPAGTKFTIIEYDGNESILTVDNLELEA